MGWGCSYSCQAYLCQHFPFGRSGFLSSSLVLQCTPLLLSIFLRLHVWSVFKDCYMDNGTFTNSFLERAETFSGSQSLQLSLQASEVGAVSCPLLLRLSCDSVNKAGCVPTFCRREAVTQRQPRMETAKLCLVPCGLVLSIDVFYWLEFYKFGCSGSVGLLLLPQKPFFHPLVEKGDMKMVFRLKVFVVE